MNMGENCSCGSRLIVHRVGPRRAASSGSSRDCAAWTVGDPQDPATRLGPMIERPHLDKVLGYIEAGRDEGARVVAGGGRDAARQPAATSSPRRSSTTSRNSMKIAREEIFGPVISTIPFDSEDEGVALANETTLRPRRVGLHDATSTRRSGSPARCGPARCAVNAYSEGDITTPFGGYKESGFGGRDKGLEAFDQYTEKKTIWISVKP